MARKSGQLGRRAFLKSSSLAAMGLAAGPSLSNIQTQRPFKILIRGGMLLDGTGNPPYRTDIGILGDTILLMDKISNQQADLLLDAEGCIVTPGFIDIHTHSDGTILDYPTAQSRVMQGVTTEVTGNCGGSAAPRFEPVGEPKSAEEGENGEPSWTDVDSYLNFLDESQLSLNHALLLGHGTLRSGLAGLVNRELDAEEMRQLEEQIAEGMDQGAFGISTGLEYIPGRFAPTDELIHAARVVARYGGFYASHIRNEEAQLLEAVSEAIEVGRKSGARIQISHLKAAGRRNWSKQSSALRLIEAARQRGIDVLADAYPYTAYATGLTIFMPSWALDGGWKALKRRLDNRSDRARILKEVNSRVKEDPGDYRLVMISSVNSSKNQSKIGRNLQEIAEDWQVTPADAVLKLLVDAEGSVGFIGHGMSPENVEMVLRHPLTMIGSDGSSISPSGSALKSRPHPRYYGAFPRVLGHYVRERKALTLTEAVEKMTSMPADQIGLSDRGRLARGKKADIVIFDSKTIIDRATFQSPHQFPKGIEHVLVNGELVVENGRHTGRKPGRALRRSS